MVWRGMLLTYSSIEAHWPSPHAAADAITDILCLVESSPIPQLSHAISYSLVLGEGRGGKGERRREEVTIFSEMQNSLVNWRVWSVVISLIVKLRNISVYGTE